LESRYEFNRIRLPLDTLNANLIGIRSTYVFSTNLFVKLFTVAEGIGKWGIPLRPFAITEAM
jgi:hypothetical protein